MIDPRVLKYFGTSNEQLRRFFTAKPAGVGPDGQPAPADTLFEQKTKFVKWVSSLEEDGRNQCFRHYRHFASVDLMNDSQPIIQENVPLMAYAQGKINVETAEVELKALNCAQDFIETKKIPGVAGKPDDVKKVVNLPRLHEVCVNIGRSLMNRRADAQNNKYESLRPFFKYETRGTSLVDHLRADVMSQYAEVMVDGYDYRHQQRQAVRAMLNYRTFVFPAGAWDYDTQTVAVADTFNGETVDAEVETSPGKKEKLRLATQVVREGVKMVRPPTARCIYDTAHPPATLNSDTGCRWVGFFDVQRYGDIAENPCFFNTEGITWNFNSGASVLDQNRAYWDLVFQGQALNFPKTQVATSKEVDLNANNERKANSYIYTSTSDADRSVFLTDLRVRVVPKEWGMGEYAHPVWLRLLLANYETVVFAEWLPSLPAVVFTHGEDDTRLLSIGMAHEIMPWQDAVSNTLSQLLMKMKHALLRIVVLNTDVLGQTVADEIEKRLNSPSYYVNPILLKVSIKEQLELGIDLEQIVRIIGAGEGTNANESEYINNAFKALVQLMAIIERLLNFSPIEQGQPMPREATAEEVAALENTTQSTYNAIGASIDAGRAAWKRIIYESTMAHASNQVRCPVAQRYSPETIKAAGFEVEPDPAAEHTTSSAKRGHTVIGTKSKLVHNYVFSSRDGGARTSSKENANVLVSLLGQVLPLIGPEAMGKRRIFEIVNEVFRLLSSYDLRLELDEGESEDFVGPQQKQQQEAATQAIGELQAALQEHEQEIAGLGEAITKLQEIATMLRQQSSAVMPPVTQ